MVNVSFPRVPVCDAWSNFLSTMCRINNVQASLILIEIYWGRNVWKPKHLLSARLSDYLFHYTELHNGNDGNISSDTDTFVDMDVDHEGDTSWPPHYISDGADID